MTHVHDIRGSAPARSSLRPIFVGSLIGLVFIILGMAIPSPYVIEKPGIVVNTLGEIVIDGKEQPVIQFDGDGPQSDATLNLLTVAIVGSPDDRLGWLEIVPAVVNPRQDVVPISQVYPQGQTSAEREAANQAMMQNSQMTATAAALNTLDISYESEVRVEDIVADSPADGVFRVGDVITRADQAPVTGMGMVRQAVVESAAGSTVEFTVLRAGEEIEVGVQPEPNPVGLSPYIGVVMGADFSFTQDITFDVDRIGGPSAGMVFSLAIVQELGNRDLTGPAVVSGTGTIDDAGTVGAIGGLTQKLWAAHEAETDVFLMPLANCRDLPDRLPGDMHIVPVATLDEAVAALDAYREDTLDVDPERCRTELAQVAPVS